MTIEKKFIRNRAFKNLMSHVMANTLTVVPALVLAGAAYVNKSYEYLPLNMVLALVTFGAFGTQLFVLTAKFLDSHDSTENPFKGRMWRNYFMNKEIVAKNLEVNSRFNAIIDLSMKSKNDSFTPAQYTQIATLQIDKKLYEITLQEWIKSQGSLARSTEEMLIQTGLKSFYQELESIAKIMDPTQLKEAENRILGERQSAQSNNQLLNTSLSDIITPVENAQCVEKNQTIYNRMTYLLSQNTISGFSDNDYHEFSRIFKDGQNSPQNSVDPLVNFLKSQENKVNWRLLIEKFKENFKGDIKDCRRILSELMTQESQHQKSYEENQLQLKAHSVVAEHNAKSHALKNSFNLEDSTTQNTGLEYCVYVNHSANYHPEKWTELKLQYDTMMAHTDQIDLTTITQMNQVLNVSLPVLVMGDVNLKTFPHLHLDAAKKLLGENLDLAINQIQAINQKISLDLIRDLRVTKNYQTMKMSG